MSTAVLDAPGTITTTATKKSESIRVGSWTWAQAVLQDAYELHGVHSERLATMVYWYVAYLFAHKHGRLHAVSVNDLKQFDPLLVCRVLPHFLQDAVTDLWIQLYTGEDISRDDGNQLLREAQRDIRRVKENTRTGMNTFRSNERLIADEARDANSSSRRKTVSYFEDRGVPIAAWIHGQFKIVYKVATQEDRQFDRLALEIAGNPTDFDDDSSRLEKAYGIEIVKGLERLRLAYKLEDGAATSEEEVEPTHQTDPKLVAALDRFRDADPSNAALLDAVSDHYRPGRKPNASEIARSLDDTTHDRVTRVIKRLRRELAAEYEASKRKPAQDAKREPTKAARAAIISPTVPAFLLNEFARTGPITEEEQKAWGHLPVQHPRGLCLNIIVADLPEDSGSCVYTGLENEDVKELEVTAAWA